MNWIDYTAEEIERIDTHNHTLAHGISCQECDLPLTLEEVRYNKELNRELLCAECTKIFDIDLGGY